MVKRRIIKKFDPMKEVRREIRSYRTQSGQWKLRLSKAETSLAALNESITYHTAVLERITNQLPQLDNMINAMESSPLKSGLEIKREKMLAQLEESGNILTEALPQHEILSRMCAGHRLQIQGLETGLGFYTNRLADYEARKSSSGEMVQEE